MRRTGGGGREARAKSPSGAPAHEPVDHPAEEGVVAAVDAQRAVDHVAPRGGGAGAGVDGPRVVVGAGVGLDPAAEPFRRGVEPVEVVVAHDRVDGARMRATRSGVTISGQAPCTALVQSTKRGSSR
jgi:hypothetical protein